MSGASRAPGANSALAGTAAPSIVPLSSTATATVRASAMPAVRVSVNTASEPSPAYTLAARIATSGWSAALAAMVRCVPIPLAPCTAVIITVSAASPAPSSSALIVAVTEPRPATRVRVAADTVKSISSVALPPKSSVISWSSAKLTPPAIATVSVAVSPSAISTGSSARLNTAVSLSVTSTPAAAAAAATV